MNKNNQILYRRLLGYIRPYKTKVTFAILAMIVSAATQPMMAAMMEPLLDGSFIAKDKTHIIWVPIALLSVFIIWGIADYLISVMTETVAQGAIATIRQQMYAKLHQLPLRIFDEQTPGYLISKISYDVAQVANALSEAWIILIRDSLVVFGLLCLLFWYSWELSLAILLIAPVVFFIVQKASQKMRHSSSALQDNMGELTHVLEEGIEGNREVKIYGAQKFENQRMEQTTQRVATNSIKIRRITALNVPLVQILAALALVLILYLAVALNSQESLSVGGFVTYITAMILIFEPVRQLTKVNPEIQKGLAAAESIFNLIDHPPEEDIGTQTLKEVQGEIEFKNLNFGFTPDKPFFTDFNLTIKARETIAIVGESGSGKTTLTNLIARFYNPQKGEILLDGVNIKDIRLNDLRKHIALVSQQVVLFNDTIKANVAYGEKQSEKDNEEGIINALSSSNAWEFVQQLPHTLAEPVGDGGSKLSGGQRQRIALARAFLKDASILILDEASSALDNQTEKKIQQAIERLAEERTTIIIAHRLSTVQNADRIIVMDKGRIVEEGTHKSLLKAKGHYAKLYLNLDNDTA